MRVSRTMTVADKVARRVGFHLRSFKRAGKYKGEAFLYPYSNGRERGYTLLVEHDMPVFHFAENRNSDEIVVYEDPEWSVYVAGLTGAGYESRKYFHYNQIEQAAKYIVRRVKTLTREYDRNWKKREKQQAKEAKDPMNNLGLRA